MKKRKVFVQVIFGVLFVAVFFIASMYWEAGWWRSSAETGIEIHSLDDEVINESGKELITVDTTFYNYRYDNEIYNKVRDQGAQSCYDGKVVPYGTFNNALSSYYSSNKVKSGIYVGNFYNYYGGLPGVGSKKLTFPGYSYFRWAANIANRIDPYDSVCQGIVGGQLDGFNIANENYGALMTATSGGGKVAVPYFDNTFLSKKINGVSIGAVKEHVRFPFRKVTSGTKKGYYEFDSAKDVVRFDGMCSGNTSSDAFYYGQNGILHYQYKQGYVYTKASSNPQFLPFNKANSAITNGTSSEQKKIDYGFGVRYDIPFFLSTDGTLNGKNMVFEFSGDDDVWIFLDGNLVLDLGGQHGKATGTIDFGGNNQTAKVTTQRVTYVKGSTNATDTAVSDAILETDTYIKSNVKTTISGIEKGNTHKHILTVFYMERGMFESNFYMAFNFVPEAAPTPAPTAVVTPKPVVQGETYKGSLKIQNELVFPTTTPDTGGVQEDKINAVFTTTMKELTDDDVFQYSIENQGTDYTKVGDSGFWYPSGKLTVRRILGENDYKGEKSYFSFGTQSGVRIYFDMSSIQKYYPSIKSIYIFSGFGSFVAECSDNSSIYYLDFSNPKSESRWMQIQFSDAVGSNTNKAYTAEFSINPNEYNGKMFKVTNAESNRDGGRTLFTGVWEEPNDSHPALGGGGVNYSSGLPYDTIGTDEKKFAPGNTTDYFPVANTVYEMTEAHLAATNSNILVNSPTTSGLTNSNGIFYLFFDDSATFLKQFATGSEMRVVQKDGLMAPKRYGSEVGESDANKARTVVKTPSPARSVSDYYHTTVKAESNGTNGTTPLEISHSGTYHFTNGADTSAEAPDITQTFTNVIKTGSLTISMKLKGHMDEDVNHSYGFKVTFSNVFGGSSASTVYSGSYILVDEDGENTANTTTGIIYLKPNQKAIISGIPVGTKYVIQELNSSGSTVNDGSIVSKIATKYVAHLEEDTINSPNYTETDATAGITVSKENRNISGIIPCSVVDKLYDTATKEFTDVDVSVVFTNQFGALTITKKIAGDVNNLEYYNKVNNSNEEKTYTFTVKDNSGNVYKGDYVLHTYEFVAANLPLKDNKEIVSTDDNGTITLKEGQKAEIGGLSLSGNVSYTIKENIDPLDIYFVSSLKVTSGTTSTDIQSPGNSTIDNNSEYNVEVTTQVFNSTNPIFDVTYTNRFSDAYIEIDKFVDRLYCGDSKYADVPSQEIFYQGLTNAKQDFIFKVKQYKTLADAQNDTNCENTFEVSVDLGTDVSPEIASATTKTFFGSDVNTVYKGSRRIRVLANRYYRIEEETSWSWKYGFKGVRWYQYTQSGDSKNIADTSVGTSNENCVILRTYLDAVNKIEDGKVVTSAEFYNALDTSKVDIEGDTDSVSNKIEKSEE